MAVAAPKQFQKCRWYDPYPRLAFALKLLGLSPRPIQEKAWCLILDETEASLAKMVQNASSLKSKPENTLDDLMTFWLAEQDNDQSARQYDMNDTGIRALMMLRNSPDSVKTKVTEKLLSLLTECDNVVDA